MANHQLLDNITHMHTRVITACAEEVGDNQNLVLTFPTEYGDVHKEYPIFFQQRDDGVYQSVALLGIEKNENLFLDKKCKSGWRGRYIPGVLARGPFLIGYQNQGEGADQAPTPVIHIDMDDPRVVHVNPSETDDTSSDGSGAGSEAVFLPHGGSSPYIERMAVILQGIHEGMAMAEQFSAILCELDLLEPVSLDIQLINEETHRISGYHTIKGERMASLTDSELHKLHQSGFLKAIYLVESSLSNMQYLVDLKNASLVTL